MKGLRMWVDQSESLFELKHRWQLCGGQKLFGAVFQWEVVGRGNTSTRGDGVGATTKPAKQAQPDPPRTDTDHGGLLMLNWLARKMQL